MATDNTALIQALFEQHRPGMEALQARDESFRVGLRYGWAQVAAPLTLELQEEHDLAAALALMPLVDAIEDGADLQELVELGFVMALALMDERESGLNPRQASELVDIIKAHREPLVDFKRNAPQEVQDDIDQAWLDLRDDLSPTNPAEANLAALLILLTATALAKGALDAKGAEGLDDVKLEAHGATAIRNLFLSLVSSVQHP